MFSDPHLAALRGIFARNRNFAARPAMPHRNAMPPPQLPRDAPVADVVHPFEVGLGPVRGHEGDAAFFHGLDRRLGQRLHLHPPLLRNQRLDDRLAAMALADAQPVRLDLLHQLERFEIRHHLLARVVTIQAGVLARRGRHLRVPVDHLDARQVVALAGLEVVGIVRRRDLHRARPESELGHLVENDRNVAIHQRQPHGLAGQLLGARIFRIDRDRGIAQHRFRTRGRHHQLHRTAIHRIGDVPQMALRVFVLDFEIRQHGLAARAPVDDVVGAIDEPLFVQAHERFAHRARQARIHREPLARPVAAIAGALHLLDDAAAVLGFPFPDLLEKLLAAQLALLDALLRELPVDHQLGGDPGVIGSRQPQCAFAAHAMPADERIDDGMLEHVAHVERARDVGRRDHQRKVRIAGRRARRGRAVRPPTTWPNAARTAGVHTLSRFPWEISILAGELYNKMV